MGPKQAMRIDFVAPRYHPVVGGIEQALSQLAHGLQDRGHPVTLHVLRHERSLAPEETVEGIPVRRYPPARRLGYYTTLFRPRLEGDLIHLHGYAHATNGPIIRRHLRQRPILLSTHHGARFPKGPLGRLYHALYNTLQGLPQARRIDALLTPTAYDAEWFADHGVPEEQIHVLPSGIDEAAFAPHRPWLPPGIRQPPLLYLGRLHREKGVHELLEAYRFARPAAPLLFAGRDEGAAAALKAREPGLDVHVLTEFTPEQKWGLLAACRALVLPSHHEGQGLVLGEAWAARKPVVATRAGAIPGVAEDGRDSLLVPVRDVQRLGAALNRINTDDALAKRLGQSGREKAEARFRWPQILDKLESLYRQALDARKPTS